MPSSTSIPKSFNFGLSTTFQSPGDQQDSHVLGSDKCSVSNLEILSEENVNVRVLSFHPRHMQGVWDVLGQRCTSADAFVISLHKPS